MLRPYKIVQCPHCNEYTYIPLGIRRNHCPRCRNKFPLHVLSSAIIFTITEIQCLLQTHYPEHHDVSPNIKIAAKPRPTAYILSLLRQRRTESPQWLPLTSIINQCLTAGLSFSEALDAINALAGAGFLEKRNEFLRVIPLN